MNSLYFGIFDHQTRWVSLAFTTLITAYMVSLNNTVLNSAESKAMQVLDYFTIASLAFTVEESHHSLVFPNWLSWRRTLMAGRLLCLSLWQNKCWAQEKPESLWSKLENQLKVIFYLFIYSLNTHQILYLWWRWTSFESLLLYLYFIRQLTVCVSFSSFAVETYS